MRRAAKCSSGHHPKAAHLVEEETARGVVLLGDADELDGRGITQLAERGRPPLCEQLPGHVVVALVARKFLAICTR